ncbi:MAG TPA: hypothetical protein VNE63_18825 [Candidatus Acidoferrales bacterium]|nr:hypothetical protein [Candidatus Acidoferrales bacterium]
MSLSFDQHAFAGKRAMPVSGRTSLTYDDYSRMEVFPHKSRAERRNETPEWSRNNALLAALLTRFMERRACLRPGTGTYQERLERAGRFAEIICADSSPAGQNKNWQTATRPCGKLGSWFATDRTHGKTLGQIHARVNFCAAGFRV